MPLYHRSAAYFILIPSLLAFARRLFDDLLDHFTLQSLEQAARHGLVASTLQLLYLYPTLGSHHAEMRMCASGL
ncbi:hypothetical protein F4818DRAFT_396694 [Hypoxylon cercidicola]|nr:hypothetical protein F4818DRAFT_396694 [Hypoxylon cercidicola]